MYITTPSVRNSTKVTGQETMFECRRRTVSMTDLGYYTKITYLIPFTLPYSEVTKLGFLSDSEGRERKRRNLGNERGPLRSTV